MVTELIGCPRFPDRHAAAGREGRAVAIQGGFSKEAHWKRTPGTRQHSPQEEVRSWCSQMGTQLCGDLCQAWGAQPTGTKRRADIGHPNT